MTTNTAKIFICHHPDQLFLYKNLIRIIRKHDRNTKIMLLKLNHPYFLKFNFEPYKKYFDQIVEFDFIHYKKNFLVGFWEILIFQNKMRKITNDLFPYFKTIDLFLTDSAWLGVNILLYNLRKQKKIKNITRITLGSLECEQTKNRCYKNFFMYLIYSATSML